MATIVRVRNMDTFRVGEDEGNQVVRQMIFGMLLGGASALVLYVVINTGFFAGRGLSQLNPEIDARQDPIRLNAMSVFLALVAGFSGRILERFLNLSERTVLS